MRTYRFLALPVLLALVLVGCGQADADSAETPTTTAAAEVENTISIPAGTYVLDPAHSEVQFRVRHMGLSTVTGNFNDATATIVVPEEGFTAMQADATIQASSVDTDNQDRDDHLRSPDFFDAENHPEITFTTTEVRPGAGNTFTLVGDLTIRGTTRPVELDAEFIGSGTDPWGNEKIGLSAEGTIDREAFGLTWNEVLETGGVLVGKNVDMVLDVQAAKQ